MVARADDGALRPEAGDLAVTAGWGHKNDGAVMPGRGRVTERDYTPDELAAITRGAEALGIGHDLALGLLGEKTLDIHLNAVTCWRNVPERVWEYTIGGYQVIKKWLSYREQSVLGRGLTVEEVREVTGMARRVAALVLLEPALNRSYAACKATAYPWR